MRISVAVTNCNYGRFLGGCIDSILEQTVPAHEIVVVDDGSTDDSLDVLAGYGDKVRVVATGNRGVAEATNTAVAHCTGDVVALLDADDLMRADRLEKLAGAYRDQPDAQWVWHPLAYIQRATGAVVEQPGVLQGFVPGRHDHRHAVLAGALPMSGPATSGLSWRREFLQGVLPMPTPMRSQDNYLKFVSMGLAPGVVLEEPLGVQGLHDSNAYTTSSGAEREVFRFLAALDKAPGLRAHGLRALERRMVAAAVVGTRGGRRLPAAERARLRRSVRAAGWPVVPRVAVEVARRMVSR